MNSHIFRVQEAVCPLVIDTNEQLRRWSTKLRKLLADATQQLAARRNTR